MEFVDMIKEVCEENQNTSFTENGALGYKTSGSALVDLNFSTASLRDATVDEIINKFELAYKEDAMLALRWLFFARDIREGMGERRLFRVILSYLSVHDPDKVCKLIELIPEYGRYDDLFCILQNRDCEDAVINFIANRLQEDIRNMSNGKPVSLLAKWMPSINTSSQATVTLAKYLAKKLKWTPKEYRKVLSHLRSYMSVVEKQMSSKNWGSIDYQRVPSKANLLYSDAFMRNDHDRRVSYLSKVSAGELNINAKAVFPYEIIHKYNLYSLDPWDNSVTFDPTVEAMWKEQGNLSGGFGDTLVVADGSYSMWTKISKTSAIEVANSLAIYFAEHNTGSFRNSYITFSESPQFVSFPEESTLLEKLFIANEHDECANTNIESVFDLILTTAVKNNLSQEDLPKRILIISDMEFDHSARNDQDKPVTKKLFKQMADRYNSYGYSLPKLVFWNVCSRTNTIPVKENDMGVALVSGFSPTVTKMVMSDKTDPAEILTEALISARYNPIKVALS